MQPRPPTPIRHRAAVAARLRYCRRDCYSFYALMDRRAPFFNEFIEQIDSICQYCPLFSSLSRQLHCVFILGRKFLIDTSNISITCHFNKLSACRCTCFCPLQNVNRKKSRQYYLKAKWNWNACFSRIYSKIKILVDLVTLHFWVHCNCCSPDLLRMRWVLRCVGHDCLHLNETELHTRNYQ